MKRYFHLGSKLCNGSPSLLLTLSLLMALFVTLQLVFTYIHYHFSGLIDTLGESDVIAQLRYPQLLFPILSFILWQLLAYALVVVWLWFISLAYGDLFQLTAAGTYWRGVLLAIFACAGILIVNTYFYPHSFFALKAMHHSLWYANIVLTFAVLFAFFFATLLGIVNFFIYKRYHVSGVIVLSFIAITALIGLDNRPHYPASFSGMKTNKPNIIFIGLDSVRPDFVSYFNSQHAHTPTIDAFLQQSVVMTQSYTPLARTFPSWISILTSRYPLHSHARNNLVEPSGVLTNDTLAKHLRAAGYQTIYASDEKRFSNILTAYGFDHVVGPKMGANDFLLGTLTDFPLTNLWINLPFGRFLFPYNYGNRAAAITYEPTSFLQLISSQVPNQSNKPLFLAIHFCLSHWPYTWARDGEPDNLTNEERYVASIEGVDKELKQTLALLRAKGLLMNAMVVLLSDHGTALGLMGDRFIREENLVGDKKQLADVLHYQLQSTSKYSADTHQYSISTAYGQGTDVLSLQQYHTLLAFRGFGVELPPKKISEPTSLLNVAPTILAWLKLAPLAQSDGMAMSLVWSAGEAGVLPMRPQFWETGDKLGAIETDKIDIQKVLQARISMYAVDPKTGLLFLRPVYERSLIENKQRAIWLGDWMLVRFPPHIKTILVRKKNSNESEMKPTNVPEQYILVNLKTGKWAVGLQSALAKQAPTTQLYQALISFYTGEI